MKKILATIVMLLVMGGMIFAAGETESGSTASDAYAWVEENGSDVPFVNPLLVSGDLVTAGSSTVAPLAAFLVERYKEDGFAGQVTIDVIGSGAGFERFTVAGESDVSNASRAIKDSEIEAAASIGRTPIPFKIGVDALSVVVSSSNTFVKNATADELALIFGEAELWSDVNPSYPAEPILRYIPGTDSGTFDFFVKLVYDKDPEAILSASNVNFSEDDNVLVQGVEDSPYAVGFFGYAYYVENQDALNILSIEGIEASLETVLAATQEGISKNAAIGGYPLARPLFMYSDAEIMRSKPQVAAYLAYVINNVNDVIEEVGYFPLDSLEEAKQNWLSAMQGAF